MRVNPLTPCIGAEVSGVRFKQLATEELSDIKKLLWCHKVLFFHEQTIVLDELVSSSKQFGDLMRVPYIKPLDDHPDVIAVLKEAHEQNMGVFGGDWHSDFSFLLEPPMASILYSVEAPPSGGDTCWINMAAAYQALPLETKAKLAGLKAVHTGKPYGAANAPKKEQQFTGSIKMDRGNPEADKETLHPAVCKHPETGELMLFISPTYTSRFDGMSKQQSQPLLRELYTHCTCPEFACRFRWRANTIAIWDNRSTMHYAVNDYDGYRRLMYRTTIAGHAPISV